ncbi:MAG: glycosyltransferase family 9 protein [Desulfobacteraceae bacterium]|nr:glycosyltransferase family 9 protein [Desulfobacteraceae bacterium]MBC2720694.1 glycosyltransferase family 9 protein [Desulfobacteraceae bacterium]
MVKDVISGVYSLFLFVLDGLALIQPGKHVQSVLLIRLDAIGDFILWLDSAQHFRKIYPDKKIILLANQACADLAKKLPFWDEVWELDRLKFIRNLLYRFHLLRKVRKAGFDVVIQPTCSREFLYGDAIVRISGAREQIGSVGDYSNIRPIEKKISDQFYTSLIPANPQPLMELKRKAEFMCGLGISMKPGLPDLSLALKGVNNPLDNVNDYYVLFPGAGWSGRQWPINRFAALAEKIYRQSRLAAVVCGSLDEQDLAESLIFQIDVPTMNITGKTSLLELAVIIKDASFLVGNETSAIHFAAAVSTPAFCLLGGGHYGRFMPYDLDGIVDHMLPVPIIHQMDCFNCNWECRYFPEDGRPVPCIEKISVEKVFAVLQPLINNLHQLDSIQ